MMPARTLSLYISRRFVEALAAVFLGAIALIAVIDFVEMLRRSGDSSEASVPLIALVTLSRAPALAEQMLPFAMLFAAIATFLNLSRRLELVIARAAGVSVWGFLAPVLALAAAFGAFATAIYNPVAAELKERANTLEAQMFGGRSMFFQGSEDGVWLRQSGDSGQAVVNARAASEGGRRLTNAIFLSFDSDGKLTERIEAANATLEGTAWALEKVRILAPGVQPRTLDTHSVPTNLSLEQVRGSIMASDAVSFWDLPAAIETAQLAGLSPLRYRLQFQSLMARPVMFVAMVLIAAAVSLRFFRFGGVAPMILGGVAAGFLLYVGAKLADDLASAGLIHVLPAAWGPGVAASVLGFMVLLHQEDG